MNLLEIEKNIDDLLAAHESAMADIEDPVEQAQAESEFLKMLSDVAEQESAKVDAYGYTLDRLNTEAERLKQLIANLSSRKRAFENQIERIEDNLEFVFQFAGRKKIEGSVYIARSRTSKYVSIFDDTKIPDVFLHPPKPREPDKRAIKEAINAHIHVPGAEILERTGISVGSR